MTVKIGVVGFGYWGPNLVRNFTTAPKSQVKIVCDLDPEKRSRAKTQYPTIETADHYEDILADKEVDAVVIATPVSTHYEIALKALQAGKHVLVEKPLASSSQEAKHLVEEAKNRNLVLMVDHIFIYTSAVRKVRELVDSGELGEILYYDSVRINLGLFQRDVNVIWDLAVHDLSILDYIFLKKPIAVSTTGISHVEGEHENIAYLTLLFEGNLIAHIHVNWLAPVKIRQTLIGGSNKMLVYDELKSVEKIKIYDKGITLNNENGEREHQLRIGYRSGDMWSPHLPVKEALQEMAQHFIHCIENNKKPITDGDSGLRVVRILEAASHSIKERSIVVNL